MSVVVEDVSVVASQHVQARNADDADVSKQTRDKKNGGPKRPAKPLIGPRSKIRKNADRDQQSASEASSASRPKSRNGNAQQQSVSMEDVGANGATTTRPGVSLDRRAETSAEGGAHAGENLSLLSAAGEVQDGPLDLTLPYVFKNSSKKITGDIITMPPNLGQSLSIGRLVCFCFFSFEEIMTITRVSESYFLFPFFVLLFLTFCPIDYRCKDRRKLAS
jgi:hypothetical protein